MTILYHADKVNYYLLIKKGYDQLKSCNRYRKHFTIYLLLFIKALTGQLNFPLLI